MKAPDTRKNQMDAGRKNNLKQRKDNKRAHGTLRELLTVWDVYGGIIKGYVQELEEKYVTWWVPVLEHCMTHKVIQVYLQGSEETLNNLKEKSEIIQFTFGRLLTDSVEDELEGMRLKAEG